VLLAELLSTRIQKKARGLLEVLDFSYAIEPKIFSSIGSS